MPALFTKISIAPKCLTACPVNSATSSALLTSAGATAVAFPAEVLNSSIDQRLPALLVSKVVDYHARALVRKPHRDRLSDSRVAAGDDRDLIGEPHGPFSSMGSREICGGNAKPSAQSRATRVLRVKPGTRLR